MIDKFLSFLGIAKKSGNLIFGMDEVKSKIISGNICLVMTTSDISSNSLEKIEPFMAEKAGKTDLIKLSYTKDDREMGKGGSDCDSGTGSKYDEAQSGIQNVLWNDADDGE